jgi:hypothetical protein
MRRPLFAITLILIMLSPACGEAPSKNTEPREPDPVCDGLGLDTPIEICDDSERVTCSQGRAAHKRQCPTYTVCAIDFDGRTYCQG